MAPDEAAWRAHLRTTHDWDPADEPTRVGDFLVAVGFGTLVFISLMMTSISWTSAVLPASTVATWQGIGALSLVAGIAVLVVRPLQQIGRRRWLTAGGAQLAHRAGRRTTARTRERLRRVDTATTVLVGGAIVVLTVLVRGPGSTSTDDGWWLPIVCVSLVVIAVAAFVRARIRRRLLT